jgi:hypothetical protein
MTLGLKESTAVTGVVAMDEDFLEELADIIKRVDELGARLEAHGKELDRLRIDVGFWTTVLLEFEPEDDKYN